MNQSFTSFVDVINRFQSLIDSQMSQITVESKADNVSRKNMKLIKREQLAAKNVNTQQQKITATVKAPKDRSKAIKKKGKLKRFVQPPMWSTRPKAVARPGLVLDAAGIKETAQPARPAPQPQPQPRPPPKIHYPRPSRLPPPLAEDDKDILAEEEFDPYKFLQNLRKHAVEYNHEKKYKQLTNLFTVAINKFPNNPSFHCNRSYAFQKMEYYGKALDDANRAIELNDLHKRAYHRRAIAYVGLGMIVNALEDLEKLMKLCPKSKKIKCRYLHCQNALNRCMFESMVTDNMSEHEVEHLFNYKTISIHDSYRGPRLRTEKITTNFLATLTKYFQNGGILHRKYVYKILFEVEILYKTVPSLVPIRVGGFDQTLIICGDIQGQYYDLIHIFERNGFPSNKLKYLFNGNFIGKGSFGVEVAILLFAYKLAFPDKIFLNRGHHETLAMTKLFGFEKEVSVKYSPTMFQIFTRIFQWLPLAHCVNNKVLVLHGGLFSEGGVTLDHIKDIKRDLEPPQGDQKITDILWSDPQKENGKQKNFRGMGGILFGPDVTDNFLRRNDLRYIIRSHELILDGIAEHHKGQCITVFTAPNYCDTYDNKGSYILLTGRNLVFSHAVVEPQRRPNIPALHYADSIHRMIS